MTIFRFEASIESFLYFLAGSALAWYLAKRFASVKRISYYTDSLQVFSEESLSGVEGFKVSFKGSPVKYVVQHSVLFWNSGTQPIWRDDLSDGFIRFSFSKKANVFLDRVMERSSNVSPEIEFYGTDLRITFPHLDSGEGFWLIVVEAFDKDVERAEPEFAGHVIGLTEAPKKIEPLPPSRAKSDVRFGLGCLGIVLVIVIASTLIFGGWSALWPPSRGWLVALAFGLLFGVATDFFGFASLVRSRQWRTPDVFADFGGWRFRRRDPLVEATEQLAEELGKRR